VAKPIQTMLVASSPCAEAVGGMGLITLM